MAYIGHQNTLTILRESTPGLYLDGGPLGEILLPKRYIPMGVRPGDTIQAFVHRDSEDRLVATTEIPFAQVGEFAYMKVTGIHERVGAFLHWGLQKDLLLPFREMELPVREGQSLVVAVCLDERTDRIYASSRLREHTSMDKPEFAVGDKVEVLLAKRINFGHFCIVAGTHHGLLNHDHAAVPLKSGDKIKAYVHQIFPDGHVDLRLDPANFRGVPALKKFILEALEGNNGKLDLDNDSSAIVIRERFGVSKNNFKLALSALYKDRKIRFLNPGIGLIVK